MRPVYQTILAAPGGNCFAACLASLLELDAADDVPNFCADNPGNGDWMAQASAWCRERCGFCLFVLRAPEGRRFDAERKFMVDYFAKSGAYVICGVKTDHDTLHAVIYKDGKMVHDPYPGGCGVLGDIVDFTVLFPVDVSRHLPVEAAGA